MKEFTIEVAADEFIEPTAGELADGMPNLAGMGVTLADIKAALATIDLPALKTQALARFKAGIWEEGDLVNGINLREHPNPEERERIVKNLDAGGNIYFIYVDGGLVYMQWHKRAQGIAPILTPELTEEVNGHIRELASGAFFDMVRAAVLKKL